MTPHQKAAASTAGLVLGIISMVTGAIVSEMVVTFFKYLGICCIVAIAVLSIALTIKFLIYDGFLAMFTRDEEAKKQKAKTDEQLDTTDEGSSPTEGEN